MSLNRITLITGLIGSGKTLRAVWYIDQEVKAGRAVYVCNLDGINVPGVIPFEDPRQWQDLPPGSLLVVDEAQRFWRARRSGEVPPELQAAETSRHDAVSMLILTQQPGYLDKHLRGLVTRHEHLYRRLGAQASQLYVWERCIEDPNSAAEKDGADQSLFVYPKHLYGAYKSAEMHNVKLRLGMRAKLIILAALVSLSLLGTVVYRHTRPKPVVASKAAAAPDAAAGNARAGNGAAAASAPLDLAGYGARFTPRDPMAPWTAPAYDTRGVVAEPRVFCMAVGERGQDGCSCYTEQVTRYPMDLDQCLVLARDGERYNPYRKPDQDGAPGAQEAPAAAQGVQGATPAVEGAQAPALAVVGIGTPGEDPKPSGMFRSQ